MASRLLQDPEAGAPQRKLFGTFAGVFTPTLLTILGVIMYLREGWVVGNAGILGSLLIILLAFLITICTGLSMSSITTNIRIGAGGAYAIISQSLGLEVGGSLGIPRYVSQALAITMYIFGLREGWLWVFPTHNAFLVDAVVFLLLWGIAYSRRQLFRYRLLEGLCRLLPGSDRYHGGGQHVGRSQRPAQEHPHRHAGSYRRSLVGLDLYPAAGHTVLL